MTNKLSIRLLAYKRAHNWNYEDFGEALGGMSHGSVGAWARGDYPPDHVSLMELSKLMKVDIWTLAIEAWDWPSPVTFGMEVPEMFRPFLERAKELAVINLPRALLLMEQWMAITKTIEESPPPAAKKGRGKRVKTK